MTNANRAERIEQLYKTLKKHYKPTTIATDRPVLDLLLYACCLEDARFEAADEAFAKLQQTYFDWNEVRVTTVAELSEVLSSLPSPDAGATRIKKCLQSLFESRYSFEIDELRKANLGKTVAELESWNGMTKFVVSFVTQNALGGHAIPVDTATLHILRLFDIVSPADADKGVVPGLERTIAKSKGPEFSSLLHQFAADFHASSKSPTALAVFKEHGVNPKPKPVAPPPPPPSAKKAEADKQAKTTSGKGTPTSGTGKGEVTSSGTAGKGLPAKGIEVKKDSKGGEAKVAPKVDSAKGVEAKPKAKVDKVAPEQKPVDKKSPSKKLAPPSKKGMVSKPPEKKIEKKAPIKIEKKPASSGPVKPPTKKPLAELKKSQAKSDGGAKNAPKSKPQKPKPSAQKITKKKPK